MNPSGHDKNNAKPHTLYKVGIMFRERSSWCVENTLGSFLVALATRWFTISLEMHDNERKWHDF
jgi:hypothetical protein